MNNLSSKPLLTEGWTWLSNSRKFHWFSRETAKSICGKFGLLRVPDDLYPDDAPSVDDCAACRAALRKRQKAREQAALLKATKQREEDQAKRDAADSVLSKRFPDARPLTDAELDELEKRS